MIPEIRHLPYEERLSNMRIQSAQRRYERYFIIYTRKCINGIVPNIGINIRRDNLSRNGVKLDVPITKETSALRRNSIMIRGPELFNLLPSDLRDLSISQEVFKSRLDEYLTLLPDRPRIGMPLKSFQSNKLDEVIRQWKWTMNAAPRHSHNSCNSCISDGTATGLIK